MVFWMNNNTPAATQVILVDPQDRPIGVADKLEAHQKNWCHRAFSICLTRNQGQEILLQKRHPEKYHCGGLWSNACCSHPSPDTGLEDSAQARLQFELGINCPIEHIGAFYYQTPLDSGLFEHEFDHVFHGIYAEDTCPFNLNEVTHAQWIQRSILEANLQKHPEDYTPWLAQVIEIFASVSI